jgi:EmrB/QacA subfamily drug resistance transporter
MHRLWLFPQSTPQPMPDASNFPRPQSTRHVLTVVSIVATAFFMEMLDTTIIVLAFPDMATDFGANPVDLSLGLTAYIVASAIFLPAGSWITDRFGARNVFCTAIATFTLASALCGLSNGIGEFVAARFIQGAAAAMMSPVGRIAVLQACQRSDFVRVMNYVTAPGLIGPVIGPPLGGLITTYASWHWIFFINIPIGVIGTVLAWQYMGNTRPAERKPFDLRGFLLNGTALACVLYGLELLGSSDAGRVPGAVLTGAGLAIGLVAIRHACQHAHPLLDLSALRLTTFYVANIGGMMFRLAMAAPIFVLPLLLQVGLGMSAFLTGVIILTNTIGDLLMKLFIRFFLRHFGFRTSLIATTISFAISAVACAFFTAATPLWIVVGVLFFNGMVRSLHMTCQHTLQYAEIPTHDLGAATTLSNVLFQLVRGAGIAFAAVLMNMTVGLRGESVAGLLDFQIALAATGAMSLVSLYWYVRLSRNSGSEISGHRRGEN